jgi:outer membrane protein OmpA-like peptidoglycan-associated protein
VVLETVGFKSGGTDILVTDRSELSALAAFIKSRPEVSVTLVGHTDNLGSLEGNIKLSLERAQSLLKFMLTEFDVPPAQISAQGIGYLSPRDNNQTAEARAHNRRVEALINQAQN